MLHPRTGTTVIAYEGFSWPAFFFGGFWYLVKGMWLRGLILFVLSLFTLWIAAIISAFQANEHYRSRLARDGYEFIRD